MDPHQSLFSRGSDDAKRPTGSPNQIDTLFQNLTSSATARPTEQQPNRFQIQAELGMASDDSTGSAKDNRQNALLSLLGPSGSSSSRPVAAPASQTSTLQAAPQQVPTPPGTGHSPEGDSQKGQYLLEQLIGGARPTYQEGGQNNSLSGLSDINSPPYEHQQLQGHYQPQSQQLQQQQPQPQSQQQQPQPQSQQQQHQQQPSYSSRTDSLEDLHQHQYSEPAPPVQPPAQPPIEPSRASMFNFVSPFDVLASGGPKKKTSIPTAEQTGPTSARVSGSTEDSWATAASGSMGSNPNAAKSIENLMGTLMLNPTPPPPQPMIIPPSSQDVSQDNSALYGDSDFTQPRPAPLPDINSPRQQPPPTNNILASVSGGPPVGASPRKKVKGKRQQSPGFHAQTIVFDVSQPLDDIQAPREAVKSTAIALVKQDPVFLPGTTIGATHWVAYAMTKGRMRVISRSSGDRTLLQLPAGTFSPTAAVTDMAVFGNRLAGVTSDGGFVVWELPDVITDDAPGQVLLCVAPPNSANDTLKFVKWHPKQADTLAVASDSKIYLLDLLDVARNFRSQPYAQYELQRISQVFDLSSDIVAFDFDPLHHALATISLDSILTLWGIDEKQASWSHKVRGDDPPSSLTPVDDGLVIGRKNGTVFQLFNVVSKNVHATIKFVNGTRDDPDMFGHANYDPRIGALWIANSRRDSLIAFKLAFDDDSNGAGEAKGVYFEQACEFCGPKPTINFVLLSADQDPTGEEAEAACVAAKVPIGELALVAFSVHSTGVDQVLIRKEWFDDALMNTPAKFPPPLHHAQRVVAPADHNKQPSQHISAPPPIVAAPAPVMPPTRIRTPQSEDFDEEPRINPEAKIKKGSSGSAAKGKNVAFVKDGGEEKNKGDARAIPQEPVASEAVIAQLLAKEMKKTEDNLHNRFVRLLGKEMDKQHNRLDDARAHDQSAEFQRQEKILQLISTELTKNTTRVVEMAVKSEVHNSVLPSLENITRSEVRAALGDHAGGVGLAQTVSQNVSTDMEQLFLRPDITNHIASLITKNLNPVIDRAVKDVMSKSFGNAYAQHQASIHQELIRDIRTEFVKFKNDTAARQGETQRAHEATMRELDHSVRSLNEQVRILSIGQSPPAPVIAPAPTQYQQHRSNDSPKSSGMNTSHIRQHLPPPGPPPQQIFPQQGGQASFQSQPGPTQGNHGWFGPSIAAPQASHPINITATAPTSSITQTPPVHQTEEWDETYLAVLTAQDSRQLQDLLSRSNPDTVMPMNARPPLSQAVLLTLLHRLTGVVAETPPTDEAFKASLWWLQRTATVININDPQISPYIARVVPNVQTLLNTTKQRMALLPGGSQLLDAARTITDVQETLRNKPM